MFFRRKKKEQEGRSESRRHYRRAPGKKHALGVKILRQGKPPLSGDLADLSAGGAGVAFPKARDPDLEPKEQVRLSFTSLVHSGEIVASATVTSSREAEDNTRRYGFEFRDTEDVFSQLDAYYFKFFNRRRAVRVRPALDKKLLSTIAFAHGSLEVPINDISPDGFGVVLQPEKAGLLEGVEDLTCTFTMPTTAESAVWHARAVHLSPLAHGVLFGAVFLIPDDEEVAARRQALADYCAARAAEIALWDTHAHE